MCDCQSTLVLQEAKKSSWESLLPPLLSAPYGLIMASSLHTAPRLTLL